MPLLLLVLLPFGTRNLNRCMPLETRNLNPLRTAIVAGNISLRSTLLGPGSTPGVPQS